jgi:predicted nucleic acid-binding protein
MDLPQFPLATEEEVLTLVESRQLFGKGIGWIDAHLLASVALSTNGDLWTLDKKLDACVKR